MPLLNVRRTRPTLLVDLNRIAALCTVAVADGALRIGATARQAAVEADADVAADDAVLRREIDVRYYG